MAKSPRFGPTATAVPTTVTNMMAMRTAMIFSKNSYRPNPTSNSPTIELPIGRVLKGIAGIRALSASAADDAAAAPNTKPQTMM